jgi:hypothetical protein
MTRFKLEDTAYTMKNNKLYEFKVKAIFIRGNGYQTTLYDYTNPYDNIQKGFNESDCFKSKVELIEAIFGE